MLEGTKIVLLTLCTWVLVWGWQVVVVKRLITKARGYNFKEWDNPIIDKYNRSACGCYSSERYGPCKYRVLVFQDNHLEIAGFCVW